MISPLHAAARDYAAKGLRVFPCAPSGKTPLTRNGFKDASNDAAQVDSWWAQWPGASIGFATGQQAGIVVLDFDKKSGGLETHTKLKEILPNTFTVRTGGGGLHLYYRYPTSTQLKNRTAVLSGFDVRAEGGYVIAPPSGHAQGVYSVEGGSLESLAELHPEMLELLCPSVEQRAPQSPLEDKSAEFEDFKAWASRRDTSEGQRNDTAYFIACEGLGSLLESESVREVLYDYAATSGLSIAEVDNTFSSALRKHALIPMKSYRRRGPSLPPGFEEKDGAIYQVRDNGAKEPPTYVKVCSSGLRVTAKTRDANGANWGRKIEFKDGEGNEHTVTMPAEHFRPGDKDLQDKLRNEGLVIHDLSHGSTALFKLLNDFNPQHIITCVTRGGWHLTPAGEQFYILPNRSLSFGKEPKEVVIQSSPSTYKHYRQSGSLEKWQENVAKLCEGNSRLELAVSTAFAAPLLHLMRIENGGLNFYGSSSIGKTTALQVAGSVWGGGGNNGFVSTWLSTANAFEGVAVGAFDGLLLLDELAQVDAEELGGVVYKIANGKGKGRQGKTGTNREQLEWRLLFISNGEVTLAQHMASKGKVAKAGQETRMVDVPADTGVHGLFENLHDTASAKEFANRLKQATAAYYGTAIDAYLAAITADTDKTVELARAYRSEFLSSLEGQLAEQVGRVADRFALIAAAGELAVHFGVLNWSSGSALRGAQACFKAWLDQRGGTDDADGIRGLKLIKAWLPTNAARFVDAEEAGARFVPQRCAGKRQKSKTTPTDKDWFVFKDVLSDEILKGSGNLKATVKALRTGGFLELDSEGKSTVSTSVPGVGEKQRCYCIRASFLHTGKNKVGTWGSGEPPKKRASIQLCRVDDSPPEESVGGDVGKAALQGGDK